MFTTPCCGRSFNGHGFRCNCGHHWTPQRMLEHDLIDDIFAVEEFTDLAEGNFGGALMVAEEEVIFDNGFGF